MPRLTSLHQLLLILLLGLCCQPHLAVATWQENIQDAMAQAKLENKDLLLSFTGSDWCHWCIKLNQEVFFQPDFDAAASQSYVLVSLDFPHDDSKQSEATRQQNEEWNTKLNIEGFPTVVLADAEGRPYATTGYQAGGPEAYLALLAKLQNIRVERDAAFAQAERADGIAKAKLLDQALQAVGSDLAFAGYTDTIQSIMELDANNEGGVRMKYEAGLKQRQVVAALQEIMNRFRPEQSAEFIQRLQAIEDEYQPTGRLRMEVRSILAQALIIAQQTDAAIKVIDEFSDSEKLHPHEKLQWNLLKSAAYANAERTVEALKVLDEILVEHADDQEVVANCLAKKSRPYCEPSGRMKCLPSSMASSKNQRIRN